MKRNHLQLLNDVGIGKGVYKFSVPIDNNENADNKEIIEKRDYRRQRSDFLSYHTSFFRQHSLRIQRRDPNLKLSHYDNIVIWSYKILSEDFVKDWGLVLERRTNLGLKLLARIDDGERFRVFMANLLEYAQDDAIIDIVPEEYAQLTLIQKFTLLTSDDIICIQTRNGDNIAVTLQLISIDHYCPKKFYHKVS